MRDPTRPPRAGLDHPREDPKFQVFLFDFWCVNSPPIHVLERRKPPILPSGKIGGSSGLGCELPGWPMLGHSVVMFIAQLIERIEIGLFVCWPIFAVQMSDPAIPAEIGFDAIGRQASARP